MNRAIARHQAEGVPFLDLSPQHAGLRASLLDLIGELIDAGSFVNGPAVALFEREFAEYCGAPYCVGTASGLDAIRLALLASGIEPGDEVIVPAATFAATFEAIVQAGGVPVPADCREEDCTLDPAAAEAAVTPRTRFLLPVHLFGHMADMRALTDLAARADLALVEDACQAHGATREGFVAGAGGQAGAFSFYPSKNLGAMGDAGALVTGDESLASQVRALREHGQREKYRHEVSGYTARLDTMQAIVLLEKLPSLDSWNGQRRAAANLYGESLAGVGDLLLPEAMPGSEPVWHLYVVRTHDPDALGAALHRRGIATGRHYPELPHLSAAFSWLGHRAGSFPNAERLARSCLSLPLFPGITEDQQALVVDAVRAHFGDGRSPG